METRFNHPVDTISEINQKKFYDQYVIPEIPVIIKGLCKEYSASKKWTIDYFKKQSKNIKVGVYDKDYERIEKSFKTPDYTLEFSDYLDNISSKEKYEVRLFLFDIFKHIPILKKDFSYPNIAKNYLKWLPFMFFGGKNSVVRMHQDMDWSNVLLTQLYGKKEVYLIHPKYSDYLYKFPFSVHSAIDIENPDFIKYPALQYVKGYRCVLEPGDTLYIPSGYWHYIKYIDGGYAVNQRFLSTNPKYILKGLLNVLLLTHLDELFNKVLGKKWFFFKEKFAAITANRHLPEFNLVNS